MANTRGGRILLGVRDDGKVVGMKDSNDIRARLQDFARNCDPPVHVTVEPLGPVILVTVRESDAKPVQCSEGFFWRQGAVTQKLSRDEIRVFFQREGSVRFDLSLHRQFRYPQDFDPEKFSAWLALSGSRQAHARTSWSTLRRRSASAGSCFSAMRACSSSPVSHGASSTRPM